MDPTGPGERPARARVRGYAHWKEAAEIGAAAVEARAGPTSRGHDRGAMGGDVGRARGAGRRGGSGSKTRPVKIGCVKAIYIEQHGGVDVLKFGEQPRPAAGPGQAVVKIVAAG